MKIKVNKDVALRNQDTGEKMILKKGVQDVNDKWGQWLCQVYALNVSKADEGSVKVAEKAKVEKPKAEAKTTKKVAKKGKK